MNWDPFGDPVAIGNCFENASANSWPFSINTKQSKIYAIFFCISIIYILLLYKSSVLLLAAIFQDYSIFRMQELKVETCINDSKDYCEELEHFQ